MLSWSYCIFMTVLSTTISSSKSFSFNLYSSRKLSVGGIFRRVYKLGDVSSHTEKDRPFTLPPGEFKPKQSLGQNFLTDQNYVRKICDSMIDTSINGTRVVEIGPGAGALTRVLYPKYPKMTCIEVDPRSVTFLGTKLPGIDIIHKDVLQIDWPELASIKGGRLNIIANLPYNIVSQVLFSLADAHKTIEQAVVTMQLEVAQRICASPNTKDYGIPSVVFQLYCQDPKILFKIPPSVFYPIPKVDSALISLDFRKYNERLDLIDGKKLRKILTYAFQQRRKMLRQSLKELLDQDNDVIITQLGENWSTKRPEQLKPTDFIDLTLHIYGNYKQIIKNDSAEISSTLSDSEKTTNENTKKDIIKSNKKLIETENKTNKKINVKTIDTSESTNDIITSRLASNMNTVSISKLTTDLSTEPISVATDTATTSTANTESKGRLVRSKTLKSPLSISSIMNKMKNNDTHNLQQNSANSQDDAENTHSNSKTSTKNTGGKMKIKSSEKKKTSNNTNKNVVVTTPLMSESDSNNYKDTQLTEEQIEVKRSFQSNSVWREGKKIK